MTKAIAGSVRGRDDVGRYRRHGCRHVISPCGTTIDPSGAALAPAFERAQASCVTLYIKPKPDSTKPPLPAISRCAVSEKARQTGAEAVRPGGCLARQAQ